MADCGKIKKYLVKLAWCAFAAVFVVIVIAGSGVRPVSAIGSCSVPVDVMLVIDTSGSMSVLNTATGNTKLADVKTALTDVTSGFIYKFNLGTALPAGDQMGLVSFADYAYLLNRLTQNSASISSNIQAFVASGQTNLRGGITKAHNELQSSRHNSAASKVIIILTDGEPNKPDSGNPVQAAYDAANSAKNDGIRIITVGLGIAGGSYAETVLKNISSNGLTDYYSAPDSGQLNSIYASISTTLCDLNPPTIDSVSRNPAGTVYWADNLTIKSTASDDVGLGSNVIKWTADGWTTANVSNCSVSGKTNTCSVGITPDKFSTSTIQYKFAATDTSGNQTCLPADCLSDYSFQIADLSISSADFLRNTDNTVTVNVNDPQAKLIDENAKFYISVQTLPSNVYKVTKQLMNCTIDGVTKKTAVCAYNINPDCAWTDSSAKVYVYPYDDYFTLKYHDPPATKTVVLNNPAETGLRCSNGIDDNCNGLTDGADPGCDSVPPTVVVNHALDNNGAVIPDGGSINDNTIDQATKKITLSSTATDAIGIYVHKLEWTSDNWATANITDCGSSANCYWQIAGPLVAGTQIKYKAYAVDGNNNTGYSAEYSFSVVNSGCNGQPNLTDCAGGSGKCCGNVCDTVHWRRPINITGSTGGTATDYQLKINLPYDSSMKPDFSDVYFTDADGVTPLSFWQEGYMPSVSSVFWVKVPLIPISPNVKTIYAYYGSPIANSLSNGANTFAFFDDFASGVIDGAKWDYSGANVIVSGGRAKLSGGNVFLRSKTIFNRGYALDYDWQVTETGKRVYSGAHDISTTSYYNSWEQSFEQQTGARLYADWNNYTGFSLLGYYAANTVYNARLVVKSTGADYYLNGGSFGFASPLYQDTTTTDKFKIGAYNWDNTVTYFDNFRLRKYISPEPAYAVGAVEQKLFADSSGYGYSSECSQLSCSAQIPSVWTRVPANNGSACSVGNNGCYVWGGSGCESRSYACNGGLCAYSSSAQSADNCSGKTFNDYGCSGNSCAVVSATDCSQPGAVNGCACTCGGYGQAEKFRKVLSFDGIDDYVNAGNKPNLNFLNATKAMTVEAWVYPTNYTGHTSDQWYMASKLVYPTSGWWFNLRNGGTVAFITCDGTCHAAYSSNTIPLNTWSHVVGWSDGVNNKVFINGQEKASVPSGVLVDSSAANLYFDNNYAGYQYAGLMSEIRLYNRALAPAEITEHYNGQYLNDAGLVGAWHLDGDANDSSANGNNGTLNLGSNGNTDSGAAWTSSKYDGTRNYSALSLDGTDDYVDAGSGSSLDITGAITISAWIKTAQTTRGEIFTRWTNSGSYPGYGLSMDNGYGCNNPGQAGIWVGDNTNLYLCSGSRTINDGVWHNVVGTYDGITAKIYIDGVLTNSGVRTNGLATSANAYIGRYSGGGYFNGLIDDLRIYSRVLSVSEIAKIYDNQFYDMTGLAGWWKFDGNAYDSSGNGHDGVLNLGTGGNTNPANAWVSGSFVINRAPLPMRVCSDGIDNNCDSLVDAASAVCDNKLDTISLTRTPAGSVSDADSVTLNSSAADSFGLAKHIIEWSLNSGAWTSQDCGAAGACSSVIGPFSAGSVVRYRSRAQDNNANWGATPEYSFNVLSFECSGKPDLSSCAVGAGRCCSQVCDITKTCALDTGCSTDVCNGINWECGVDVSKNGTGCGAGNACYIFNNIGCEDRSYQCAAGLCSYTYTNRQESSCSGGNLNTYACGPSCTATTVDCASVGTSNGTNCACSCGGYGQREKFYKTFKSDGVDDYINVPNSSSLNPTAALTVESWVYRMGNTAYWDGIISKMDYAGGTRPGYYLGFSSNNYLWFMSNNQQSLSASPVPDRTWTHVVGVYDGAKLLLYVNGVLQPNPGALTTGLGTSTSNLRIAGLSYSSSYSFGGLVGETRLYNRAVSATEVSQHFNGQYLNDTGLVADWHLDGSAADNSGNGHNGTIALGSAGNTDPANAWANGQTDTMRTYSSLSVDGVDDYVQVPNSAGLNLPVQSGGQITMEAWVYPLSVSSEMGVISKRSNYRMLILPGGALKFQTFGWTSSGTVIVKSKQWSHIAITYNGTTKNLVFYVNGVSETLSSYVPNGGTNSDNLLIGNGHDGSYYFNGIIDEARIYNRELPLAEIVQHYNGQYLDNTGLAGSWSFDGNANDGSGSGHDGVLTLGTAGNTNPANAWVSGTGVISSNVPPPWRVCTDGKDNDCNGLVDFQESACDNKPPLVVISRNPSGAVYSTDSVVLNSTATDEFGIQSHKVRWTRDNWSTFTEQDCPGSGVCSITVGPLAAATVVKYKTEAADNNGNLGFSSEYQYFVSDASCDSQPNGVSCASGSGRCCGGFCDTVHWRKPITVSGSSAGAVSNYQVRIDLAYESKMKADFSDVYFTDADGVAPLPFWRESFTSAAAAVFWVKVPAIPLAPGAAKIYVYYGSPIANSASNGAATFDFYDDFESGNLNKWTAAGDSNYWEVAGDQAYSGNYSLRASSVNGVEKYLIANGVNMKDVAVDAMWKESDINNIDVEQSVRVTSTTPINDYDTNLEGTTGWNIAKKFGGTWTEIEPNHNAPTVNVWNKITAIISGTQMKVLKDDVQITPATGWTGVGSDIASGSVGFSAYTIAAGNYWWIDDVRARKYISPEPAVSVGGEESKGLSDYLLNAECSQLACSSAPGLSATWTWIPANEGNTCSAFSNGCYAWPALGGTGCEMRTYACNAGSCGYTSYNQIVDSCSGKVFNDNGCSGGLCGNVSANDCSQTGAVNGCACACGGYGRDERFYSALRFDGVDDNIWVGKDLVSDRMSIEFWVKPENLTDVERLIDNGNGGGWGPGPEIALWLSGGKVGFLGSSSYGAGDFTIWTPSAISRDWTHVVAVLDDTQSKLYLNGNPVPVASRAWAGAFNKESYNFNNFNISGRSDRRFSGFLDGIRVYNRVLTPAEITQHYSGQYLNETGLVGWWSLDGNAGDGSGNGNNGTLDLGTAGNINPANAWTSNRNDTIRTFNSFKADGTDDYVKTNDNSVLKGMNVVSVEAWFRPELTATGGGISKWNAWTAGTGGSYILWLSTAGPAFQFGVVTSTATKSVNSGVAYEANVWYHVVGVYDGSMVKIYVNGILKASDAFSGGAISSTADPLYIGRYNASYYKGQINNVRIYSRALTDDEVYQHFNGRYYSDSGLVGWWKLDNNPADSSVYANNGALNLGTAGNINPANAWASDSLSVRNTPSPWRVCADGVDNNCNGLKDSEEISCDNIPPILTMSAINNKGNIIPNGGTVVENDMNKITLASSAADANGIAAHKIEWTNTGWTSKNVVDCSLTDCATYQMLPSVNDIIRYRSYATDNNGNTSCQPQDCSQDYSFTVNPNNRPPVIVPTMTAGNYCQENSLTVKWTFTDPDGDAQSAYNVEISNDPSFTTLVPGIGDKGIISSSSKSYTVSTGLLYNKTKYYARVKAWDDHFPINADSGWVDAGYIETPIHEYPTADFNWDIGAPKIGDMIRFSDRSTVYGGAAVAKWEWNFDTQNCNLAASPVYSVVATNPPSLPPQYQDYQYMVPSDYLITLKVIDSDGYSCTTRDEADYKNKYCINVGLKRLRWKEVVPQ